MSKATMNPDDLIAELDALLGIPTPKAAAPLVLPPPAAPPKLEAAPPSEAPKLRTPRILIVDDNEDYRETVRFYLNEKGYDVSEAGDGEHGLRMARTRRPDLILLDFNMPNMNGYELVQELRSDAETREIPLIMFTGSPNRKHLRGTLPDLVDFLEKPVGNAKLLAAIRKAVGDPVKEAAPEPELEQPAEPAAQAAAAPKIQLKAPEAEEEQEDDELSSNDELLVDAPQEAEKVQEDAGLEVLANDSPLIARVNKILVRAVEVGASDIHIEPQEKELVVRLRVNGVLQKLCAMPISLAARLVARVKIMASLIITERRLPQDGQIRATIKGKKVEFRVSTLPSLFGEKIVLRVLGGGKIKNSLAELGTNERDLHAIEQALKTPNGLILVTGPTGSGKSTTLYSMIRSVNTPDVNIMTAEDPVEYELPGITQVPVRPKIGLTFESVLRSFLRQDPDVMLVGEIRDLETAEIAVKAAITGHLVFSTLHTNSAPATLMRLSHMGVAPYLLAAAVKLVVAQRLVRALCPSCRIPVQISEDDKRMLSEAEEASLKTVHRAVGCRDCSQTGYKGRMPIFEVMPVRTPAMRQLILKSDDVDVMSGLAVDEGMETLRAAALRAVAEGSTSLAEALKVVAE